MSSHFQYRDGTLYAESVDLQTLASKHGTPLFVSSRTALESQYNRYQQAFAGRAHLICYAVKANSNLAVLECMAKLNSGFDVVSGEELERVLKAGGDPEKTVFSGVAKTTQEMEKGLEAGIYCFNVESQAELELLAEVAHGHGISAPISIRVNPDIKAGSHAHLETGTSESKFGVPLSDAQALYLYAAETPSLKICGIDCHIGSQIHDFEPLTQMIEHMLSLADKLEQHGISIQHLDIGGGLGVRVTEDSPFGASNIEQYARAVNSCLGDSKVQLLLEPGRALIGAAGILLTQVRYLKPTTTKHFAIVDAGMSHFIRPALYGAAHPVIPVKSRSTPERAYEIAGPVCESADILASDQMLSIEQGDVLAVCMTGAYGAVMASNYNALPRPAEIMVHQEHTKLVRTRENSEDMWRQEYMLGQ
jgi:diaminopimelate decarboxylase